MYFRFESSSSIYEACDAEFAVRASLYDPLRDGIQTRVKKRSVYVPR